MCNKSFSPIPFLQDVPAQLSHIWKCFLENVPSGPYGHNPISIKCISSLCQGFWQFYQTGVSKGDILMLFVFSQLLFWWKTASTHVSFTVPCALENIDRGYIMYVKGSCQLIFILSCLISQTNWNYLPNSFSFYFSTEHREGWTHDERYKSTPMVHEHGEHWQHLGWHRVKRSFYNLYLSNCQQTPRTDPKQ